MLCIIIVYYVENYKKIECFMCYENIEEKFYVFQDRMYDQGTSGDP